MATYTETVQQVTDQYLTALTTAQDTTVERIAAAVAQLPELPATVPAVELPAGVPTAAEVNAASFAAVESLVANQRAFAEKFLAAAKV